MLSQVLRLLLVCVSLGTFTSAAGVTVTPTVLDFGNQLTSTVSTPLSVTVANNSGHAVPLTVKAPAQVFLATNGCGASLAVDMSCSIQVRFAPPHVGPLGDRLLINAGNIPLSVRLTGNGVRPALTFPSGNAFTICCYPGDNWSMPIPLLNSGNGPLLISAISNNFVSETNNCPAMLAPGSGCTITASVAVEGYINKETFPGISIVDNAPGSPHLIFFSLDGPNFAGNYRFSPPDGPFFPLYTLVGSTRSAGFALETGDGNGPVIVRSAVATGDFSVSGAPGLCGPCFWTVTFTPTAAGARTGTLTLNDDAGGSFGTQTFELFATATFLDVSAYTVHFSQKSPGPGKVRLYNTGGSPISITGITPSPAEVFLESDDCPAVLPPQDKCDITVSFTGNLLTVTDGVLTVHDDDPGGPHQIALHAGNYRYY